jgi:hypothetical protein
MWQKASIMATDYPYSVPARNRAISGVYEANSKMLRKLAVHAQASTFLRDMRAQFAMFKVRISQTETLECIVRRAAKDIKACRSGPIVA